MKKFASILIIMLLLTTLLAACQDPGAQTADPSTEPVDTSPLVTVDPSASVLPSASILPSASPSGSPGLTPTGSASASPSPTASASAGANATLAPAKTYAPLDDGFKLVTKLSDAVKASDYVVICTVEEDLGVRNIMKGTSLGNSLPNAVLNSWEYKVKITEVLKTASGNKIAKDTEIVYSIPFEINLKKDKDNAREQPFVQLTVGETYVIMLQYDDYYKVYTIANIDPNKFHVEGDNLRFITGVTANIDAWKMMLGSDLVPKKDFLKLF